MIEFRMGPVGSLDSVGQPYVTLTSHGIKQEGAAPSHYNGAHQAWDGYWKALNTYLAEMSASIVEWRACPALEGVDGKLWVRSRLSVVARHDG